MMGHESLHPTGRRSEPYRRRPARVVAVGGLRLGGSEPILIQSMAISDTLDTDSVVREIEDIVHAGCPLVRVTCPSVREADNLGTIKKELRQKGINVPLVADIHFTPNAALRAADLVEKVRINPGNYADRKRFAVREYSDDEYALELERIHDRFKPLVLKLKRNGVALRIGSNHGSLSDRILNRYGDTPEGMVESALEFVRICRAYDYHDIVLSMKSSVTSVAIAAHRLLVERMAAEEMDYPIHLGITEAGAGLPARLKSAVGIGGLLLEGIGDTIRVSLTEPSVNEVGACYEVLRAVAAQEPGFARYLPDEVLPPDHLEPFDEEAGRAGPPDESCRWSPRRPVDFPPPRPVERLELGFYALGDPGRLPVRVHYRATRPLMDAGELGPELSAAGGGDSRPEAFWVASGLDAQTSHRLAALQRALRPSGASNIPIVLRIQEPEQAGSEHLESILPWVHGLCVTIPHDGDTTIAPGWLSLAAAHQRALFFEGAEPGLLLRRAEQALAAGLPSAGILLRSQGLREAAWELQHTLRTHPQGARIAVVLEGTGRAIEQGLAAGTALLERSGEALLLGPEELGGPAAAVSTAYEILQATRLRVTQAEFISCPSCGRTQFDLETTTERIRRRTGHLQGVKIAVMGCIVNGPGEMADADFGYVGSGADKIDLYRGHTRVRRNLSPAEADEALVELIREAGRWVDPPDSGDGG
ncbi:MAG: (E)-4-hydroxy-3-methylbut-2-enyl-diphosphate synthase [Candidatus Eisenbacteria bacterium]|nr:(E)-4-hydroxy-3-methylbut-2-enyl-diphosphate synthase [Candidatus Eisenbacteria bacterium]